MTLEFNDTSFNGSGSLKVFTCTGTKAELIAAPIPERFKDSPNTMFMVECTDGTAMILVNDDATEISVIDRSHFIAISTNTVPIGTDAANPSVFTGMSFTPGSIGFELRGSDGAVKNTSGRTLQDCAGTISFQPNKTGGGTTVMQLSSQISADGVSWDANPASLRVIEIPNNGETFKTAVSIAINWPNDYYVRFVAYISDGGGVSFESPSETIAGNPVFGASVVWELREL